MSGAALAGPGGPPGAGWRLARKRYADLSGEGARLKGGRWNSPGRAVVYMAEDAALPLIEVLGVVAVALVATAGGMLVVFDSEYGREIGLIDNVVSEDCIIFKYF